MIFLYKPSVMHTGSRRPDRVRASQVAREARQRAGVAFVGGRRYPQPLDPTSAKKFRVLAGLRGIFCIGFSENLWPRHFTEFAQFYLFPKWPLPVLRYLTMFFVVPWLTLWLIWRHGVGILVAQSPYEGFAAACAKVIARWLGRRVTLVVESHGDFEESLFLQRRVLIPPLYRFLMQGAAHFALTHADVLRAVSNSTWEQLQRWAPGKPIVQFVAWTDIDTFLNAKRDPVCAQALTILFVGVLVPQKCVHLLIEAFEAVAGQFPRAQLLIVGEANNCAYRDKLEIQRKASSARKQIVFRGPMPQLELASHMAQARAVVLPSSSEGLGRVVFEAMACGTPVIGSAVGGIPDMIENGKTGFLVPPGDQAALAERLHWVLDHPSEAREMGERARDFAQRFFSSAGYVEGYRRLFESAEAILHT